MVRTKKPPLGQTMKHKKQLTFRKKLDNPVLKKLALAFVIVIIATVTYLQYLAPHTLEAKQRVELESTQHQLIETKRTLQDQKTLDAQQDAEKQKQLEEIQKKLEETEKALQAKRSTPQATVAYAAEVPVQRQSVSSGNNEDRIWNFLIGQGFTRNQTAGIMGNLKQEHNFNTSDVGGGLGIAQWIGGRRANLVARGDYTNLDVQLQFLMDELNGVERVAGTAIRAAGSVEGAVVAFQNNFERCGVCMEGTRVQYAYDILNRH